MTPNLTRTLIALALGGVVYFATGQVVAGILASAFGFWLAPQLGRRPATPRAVPTSQPRRRPADGVAVVCKQVTPLRQEWVSVKTGRLYDVLSPNGLHDARPGDRGEAVLEGSSYRIRRSPE